MKTKEIIKIIETDGWCEVRQKGSHKQYKHPIKKGWLLSPFIACQMIWHQVLKRVF